MSTSNGVVSPDAEAGSSSTLVDRGATGAAVRGAPNDFAFRPQDRLEIKAYRETLVDRTVEVGAVAKIDPNVATCWRLRAKGAVTLNFVDPEPVADLDDGAPAPSFVTSIVIRISRPQGASITWPAGCLFPKPLRDLASGDGPLGPASEDSLDEYVAEYWPGDGWAVNNSAWRLG